MTSSNISLNDHALNAAASNASYQSASPYAHIVIDDLLNESVVKEIRDDFPSVGDEGWIHYLHYNEKKHGLNKMEILPHSIQSVIQYFNSPEMVRWLEELTGIPNLIADIDMEGGGLHQSKNGGFLNVHADFTVHPHKRNWQRRVNLLLYLNENWKTEYGGALELWSKDMKRCEQKIEPLFNRCVIFNTDADSYHGFPDPMTCPEGVTRKSIALYYFTEEAHIPQKRSTNYQARPNDGIKGLFIYLDKKAVAIYSKLKGWLGINDDFVSNVLRKLGKK